MAFALQFDGVNDYVTTGTASTAGATNFEIEFSCSVASGFGRVYAVAVGDDADRIIIWNDGSKVSFRATGVVDLAMAGVTISDMNTYKITGDGVNLRLYVNESLQSTTAYTGISPKLGVIGSGGNAYHNGQFGFFTYTDLDAAGNSRNYLMEEGTGSSLVDSINGETGTLVNFPTDDTQWINLGGAAALLADDLESSTEVSTPTIGQIHALTAGDLQSVSTVSSPTLTVVAGTDALLADDLESISTVSTPTLDRATTAINLESGTITVASLTAIMTATTATETITATSATEVFSWR